MDVRGKRILSNYGDKRGDTFLVNFVQIRLDFAES